MKKILFFALVTIGLLCAGVVFGDEITLEVAIDNASGACKITSQMTSQIPPPTPPNSFWEVWPDGNYPQHAVEKFTFCNVKFYVEDSTTGTDANCYQDPDTLELWCW